MTIRLRFTLTLAAVGLLLFGTYAVWSYRSESEDLHAAARADLRVVGESIETALENALRDHQATDVRDMLATIELLSPHLDIHLYGPSGELLARSTGAVTTEEIVHHIEDTIRRRRDTITLSSDDLIFAAPLMGRGELVGAIAVVRPLDELTADLERTRARLLLALAALVIATLAAGLALGTFYVSRPLKELLRGVRHVREGNFRAQVPAGHADELGELVQEFNAMSDALEQARARSEADAEARSRLEAGLQRVDKLVTIGQLSAGLAHEIGSPLQVLSGRASTLLEHGDPEVRRQATLLVAECDRITRVVEQLLSFGRRKPTRAGPCDLVTPIQTVIDMLAGEATRRGITMKLETDGRPQQIIGDVDQLQQIALNLVRNALNATPAGGAITIRIDRVADRVRLSVRDTGHGIPAAAHAKVFEPFFTTRASEGGTGLGLAVVRALALEHQATIDLFSEEGGGAELVVSFPYRPEVRRA